MLRRVIHSRPLYCSAFSRFYTTQTNYNSILFERKDNGVVLITLNRPKALNALNQELCRELGDAISNIEKDETARVTVITGNEKAFAAGADIKEMSTLSFIDVYKTGLFSSLDVIPRARKPIIAAVNGYALGGGCELAMMCDFIIAGDKAKFGQPEIKLGTIPGIGGSQRLTRAIGKSRSMELTLTGDMITAQEAEQRGLVSRVVPQDKLVDNALETANKIASYSSPIGKFMSNQRLT
jgi:enoyl-CoA hydratase/carnithine racemase